ncbi:flocculation protein FLO11-like [Scleropages formosus]|uniref:flocculation protein FLO11-like n=1 Tax=Scleropages formosus TaxID=113540 RepID=UPI0008784D9D|nr:flocculation protein FLO11-like [Scleropages formosus]
MEPSSVHRQSLPYDGIGQLLSSLQPLNNGASTLLHAHSSESEYFPGQSLHSCISSGRTTAPTTPTIGRRSSEVLGSEEGQRSFVTFSYIEKASIRSVESPQSSLCLRGPPAPANPLRRSVEERTTPAHLRKRLSDPIHLGSQDSLCSASPKLHCQASGEQPPNLRHATIDFIARAATHRALEEFGSPELQRRAVNVSDSPGPSTSQQSRCQSRNSSPAPVRSASTLPSTCVADPQKNIFGCSLPRSPATEQLSSHTRQPAVTLPPSPKSKAQESPRPPCKPTPAMHDKPSTAGNENLSSKRIDRSPSESPRSAQRVNFNLGNFHSQLGDGMKQLGGKKSVSPVNSPEVARKLAEEATKLSTIFMEARRSSSPTPVEDSDSPNFPCYLSQESQRCSFSPDRGSPMQHHTEMNIPLHGPSRRDSDCLGGRHHTVKADINSPVHLRKEQRGDNTTPSRQSPALPNIESPPIPTKLQRASPLCADMIPSPITDPRQHKPELLADDSPVLHQDQPPQYMGKSRSPSPEWSHKSRYERGMRDCPEVTRKAAPVEHCGISNPEGLVSRNSQQQWGNAAPAGGNSSKLVLQDKQFVATTSIEPKGIEQSSIEADKAPTGDRGKNGLGALLKSEAPAYGDQSGMLGSSHSSSGVTGSLGDSSQPDHNCMSLETSQSSQKSSDTVHATSVIQSDSGCSPMGPSLHSQRIARAKWEFLFGTPSSEGSDSAVKNPTDIGDSSTAPPSGTSSESPTPTPPNSLPLKTTPSERGPEGMSQSLASHNVQHVEVELVTPPPAAAGASPKTGIIRRTIKYSETDLDAVPLRCYRETNIDEVLAEQEEADSAFGSNRSVMGTSGAGSSPLEGALYVRTDGEEDLEEELQDEEVVSWASVRMQGDRKRQHATQEEDEVYSLLLKRPLGSLSESPTALKSPIAVTSPRRVSEDGLDTFSRHFESIMESHRAKGTSYSSLDSEDLLTSSQAVFTFDLPTLTPEIQGQICQSARDIIELSFAPLAQSEPSSSLDCAYDAGDQLHSGGSQEIAQVRSSEGLISAAEDIPPSMQLSTEEDHRRNTHPQARSVPGLRYRTSLKTHRKDS